MKTRMILSCYPAISREAGNYGRNMEGNVKEKKNKIRKSRRSKSALRTSRRALEGQTKITSKIYKLLRMENENFVITKRKKLKISQAKWKAIRKTNPVTNMKLTFHFNSHSFMSSKIFSTAQTTKGNLLQRFCSGWLGHWNCCQMFHWMFVLAIELLLLLLFL